MSQFDSDKKYNFLARNFSCQISILFSRFNHVTISLFLHSLKCEIVFFSDIMECLIIRMLKNLERKLHPYGLVYSWCTLSLRSFLRGQNWKFWQMAPQYVHIWGKVGNFEWLMSDLRKKGEKWNGISGIWTQVCLVRVHNVNHYTIGDCCGRIWILNLHKKKFAKKIWPLQRGER